MTHYQIQLQTQGSKQFGKPCKSIEEALETALAAIGQGTITFTTLAKCDAKGESWAIQGTWGGPGAPSLLKLEHAAGLKAASSEPLSLRDPVGDAMREVEAKTAAAEVDDSAGEAGI